MLTKVMFLHLHRYLCVSTCNNCNSLSNVWKTGAFSEFLNWILKFKMAVLNWKFVNVVELFSSGHILCGLIVKNEQAGVSR